MSEPATIVELSRLVAPANLVTDPGEIGRRLRDNSWLSPVLKRYIDHMADTSGRSLDVAALVAPANLDELSACVSRLYRDRVPIVLLGAGTTNFGQTTPLDGGVVVEMRHFASVSPPEPGRITVGAGSITAAVDAAAHESGQELPIMTTTYATATSGGWVAGGHLGLGAPTWGTIWDGNVLGATVLTVEDEPRSITLDAGSLEPVLHSYGTTGILTDVTFRLVDACHWTELVVGFRGFDHAIEFTESVSRRSHLRVRAAAAQEPIVTPCFGALEEHVAPTEALVLSIVDDTQYDEYAALAREHGGRTVPWRGRGADHRPTLAYMVYGHRMLWVKKLAPRGAFLHCYLDPDDALGQLNELKGRFGDHVMLELKFLRSRWMRERLGYSGEGVLPAPLVCVVEGERDLTSVMGFCDQIGVRYQNPHTFHLDQKGLLRDPEVLKRFKAEVDPRGLLNPGKLSDIEVVG